MLAFWIGILAVLGLYLCLWLLYYETFNVRSGTPLDLLHVPEDSPYAPYRSRYEASLEYIRSRPAELITIQSFDGLELRGRYYAGTPGSPLRILFHGYRSAQAENDFCCGLESDLRRGFSVLLVDQRGQGRSQGDTITFGVLERVDCLSWAQYAAQRFGLETPVILGGMSMGAATVLMASCLDLPENVAGIVADSGYTSPGEIIRTVLRRRGLPPGVLYPLIRLSARLFGRFDPDAASAREAVASARVPVLFIHGQADELVPCSMAQELYQACAGEKELVTVPGAGHGLAYVVDTPGVSAALEAFYGRVLREKGRRNPPAGTGRP